MFSFKAKSFSAALVVALAALGAQPALSDGFSGPYLAGRIASQSSDYRNAAMYYGRALVGDPTNAMLLESAILAQIGQGEAERAIPYVEQMRRIGAESQIGNLVALAKLAKDEDYDGLIAALESGADTGPLVDGLFVAWSELGRGQMSDALTAFDSVAAEEGLLAFGLYHKALALASVGDFEGADRIFSGQEAGPLRVTRRGVLAHVQILSQLERNEDALELIGSVFGGDPEPEMELMRVALEQGETLPFTVVGGPGDGLAEVLYTVAGALNGESTDVYTLVYARLAEYLHPDHTDAALLTAGILEMQGQYDLATEAYNRISRDNPAFHIAELGRADSLIKAGRTDAAIEVLQQLAKSHSQYSLVWMRLGDTLRREERYDAAIDAYDSAIALFGTTSREHWVAYYARGICNEREKNWDAAEADFRTALRLQPDQPSVLNYLGYSFLEMNTNLDEALSMIERAVAAQPGDGYITDSLGWALYRMGKYDEAVVQMEKAVELMPVDSVVNDHLGDVYWAVGRKLEAEFQWKRALSFEPESDEAAERIRRKLEVGLDVVLKEEGSEPLAVSSNGRN